MRESIHWEPCKMDTTKGSVLASKAHRWRRLLLIHLSFDACEDHVARRRMLVYEPGHTTQPDGQTCMSESSQPRFQDQDQMRSWCSARE